MICRGCHSEGVYKLRVVYDRELATFIESCNSCDGSLRVYVGDAFFKEPYFEEHLADSNNPQGRWISGKNEKARLLKEQGLIESGDRTHGGR